MNPHPNLACNLLFCLILCLFISSSADAGKRSREESSGSEKPVASKQLVTSRDLNSLTPAELSTIAPLSIAQLSQERVQSLSSSTLIHLSQLYEAQFPFALLSDTQWASLPDRLADQHGANISPCCTPVLTQIHQTKDDTIRVDRLSPGKNPFSSHPLFMSPGGVPYFVSAPFTSQIDLKEDIDYRYQPPTSLGHAQQIPSFRMRIPKQRLSESETEFYRRRYRETFSRHWSGSPSALHHEPVTIGNGSTALVFQPNPMSPPKMSHLVIKIRKPFPWLHEQGEADPTVETPEDHYTASQIQSAQNALEHAKKDLVIGQVLAECAQNFLVPRVNPKDAAHPQWDSIIEVEEYPLNRMDLLRKGIFLQEDLSREISAAQLEQIIDRYEHPSDHPRALSLSQVNRKLSAVGITDVNEGKTLLALLEKFYERTQLDLIHFKEANHLIESVNFVTSNAFFHNYLMTVGADFNRGHNAFWSSQDHHWHLIDF